MFFRYLEDYARLRTVYDINKIESIFYFASHSSFQTMLLNSIVLTMNSWELLMIIYQWILCKISRITTRSKRTNRLRNSYIPELKIARWSSLANILKSLKVRLIVLRLVCQKKTDLYSLKHRTLTEPVWNVCI